MIKRMLWFAGCIMMMQITLHANTIHVPADYKTIAQAVHNAKPFDTVYVNAGIYRECPVILSKPISFIGVNYPVIDGQFKYENISVKSSHVKVSGFRVINTGYSSMEDMAGIKTYSASHVIIENNILQDAFFGIYFTNCRYCSVLNNRIRGPVNRNQNDVGNGIHFWKSSYNKIINNRISGHRDGIYFEFVRGTVIAGNFSTGNLRYGLHFMFSDSDNYYHNTFLNNGAGVAVMYSRFVNMIGNNFDHNWGGSAYGLLLKDIRDSYICGNRFVKNTVGIHIEGCSRSLFFRNQFIENGYAIRLQADCDENRLLFNNFLLNTFDMITNGNTVLNELSYNYWDKYEGYDMQRDGVGDLPYRPMNLFSSIIESSPVSVLFLKSFLADMLDALEKIIPGLTPQNLQDHSPLMKAYARDQAII